MFPLQPALLAREFSARSRPPEAAASTLEVSVAGKIVYWVSTVIVAVALLGSLTYLTGSEQVVSGFAKAGYPQYLRIILGIAKPLAAVVLLLPGVPLLKEWAYAGVTIALVMATISAYDTGQMWAMPLALLVLVMVSCLTRPATRRVATMPAAA
jgi:DoxX-like family